MKINAEKIGHTVIVLVMSVVMYFVADWIGLKNFIDELFPNIYSLGAQILILNSGIYIGRGINRIWFNTKIKIN
jgi:hypothetical protein